MVNLKGYPNLGPFRLTGELARGPLGPRWQAIHEERHTTHVVHEFPGVTDRERQRRFMAAIERAAELRHAHLVPIEFVTFSGSGSMGTRGWVVTPYSGNQDGLVTLDDLLRLKGGRMEPGEVGTATLHMLEAVRHAHAAGHVHGELAGAEVLVDRSGSTMIELYGLRRALAGPVELPGEESADEVRSVVALAYRLLTGLPSEEPRIPAGKLIRKLDPRWDDWFDTGLSAVTGFATAAEAMDRLPGHAASDEPARPSPVAVVVGLLRSAFASTRS